ncbi:MAG: serine hydrolase domain-containing protein, partial [Acidimicrobiales bacterium]
TGAFGDDPLASTAMTTGGRFDITSATKSFTATLVFQLADQGLIDLDGPLPALDAAPDFSDHAAMTARQLLAHRSGLRNYRDTPEFRDHPEAMDTPEEAVAASVKAARSAGPGKVTEYSSTNYLILGMLLEQATGQRFDALLSQRLLRPLRLTRTTHDGPGPGTPNFSTSGIFTDVGYLLRWGTAAYRDRVLVSPTSSAAMRDIDPDSSLGPGSVGMCPCHRSAGGALSWEWIGYTGSTTVVEYSAARDLVVVVRVTDDLWQAGRFPSVQALASRLDALVVAAR